MTSNKPSAYMAKFSYFGVALPNKVTVTKPLKAA
jgi:hypothetical protein